MSTTSDITLRPNGDAAAEPRQAHPESAGNGSSSGGGRMIQLDILRGVAILLVLGRHSIVPAREAGFLSGVAGVWERFGWAGVDLFFVLSGFLVGGLLFKEIKKHDRLDVARFLVRRGFKIWPSFYLYVLYLLILAVALAPPGQSVLQSVKPVLPTVLHIQNYKGTVRSHTWSLAVEEHFYLLLPLGLLLLLHLRRRGGRGGANNMGGVAELLGFLPGFTLFVAALCLGLRIWTGVRNGGVYSFDTHLAPTHLRIDSLLFGVLLAYLHHFRPEIMQKLASRRTLLGITGVLLVAPMLFTPADGKSAFVFTIGFTMLFVGFGCLLITAVYGRPGRDSPWGRFLESGAGRAVAFIGFFSYPIYLWHLEISFWYGRLFGSSGGGEGAQSPLAGALPPALYYLVGMTIYITLAIVIGVFFSKIVEGPALALRDRLFPSRAEGMAVSADSSSGVGSGGNDSQQRAGAANAV